MARFTQEGGKNRRRLQASPIRTVRLKEAKREVSGVLMFSVWYCGTRTLESSLLCSHLHNRKSEQAVVVGYEVTRPWGSCLSHTDDCKHTRVLL